MTGWARIANRRRWHMFAPWEANEFFLVPKCGREITLHRAATKHLKQRADLPPFALLCKGCAAADQEAA